jgi:hypothetical protein
MSPQDPGEPIVIADKDEPPIGESTLLQTNRSAARARLSPMLLPTRIVPRRLTALTIQSVSFSHTFVMTTSP